MELSERVGFRGNHWGISSVVKVNEETDFTLVILESVKFLWGYLYDE